MSNKCECGAELINGGHVGSYCSKGLACPEWKITKLHEGDQRYKNLLIALKKEIYARATGMPIPSIIGVLDMLKDVIKEEQKP